MAARVVRDLRAFLTRPLVAAECHRLLADLEAPPFVDQSFDFVVAAASVQRTELPATLAGLRRLVTPGGRLALYVTVSSFPRLRDCRPVRILMNLRQAVKYVRVHDFPTAWRLFRFQTSRAWLQQADMTLRLRYDGADILDTRSFRQIPSRRRRRSARCVSDCCRSAGWKDLPDGR